MQVVKKFDLADFQWKDRNGDFHSPKDMKTRHIFYTLRMIWNHSVDDSMQIAPFKRYNFSSFYTVEYMMLAIKHLSTELKSRDDLTDEWVNSLTQIAHHINRNSYWGAKRCRLLKQENV